jgi:hypothetical protein
MPDRVVVRCAPAVAGIGGVDVLGSMDEMTDGTGTSVDAAMGRESVHVSNIPR